MWGGGVWVAVILHDTLHFKVPLCWFLSSGPAQHCSTLSSLPAAVSALLPRRPFPAGYLCLWLPTSHCEDPSGTRMYMFGKVPRQEYLYGSQSLCGAHLSCYPRATKVGAGVCSQEHMPHLLGSAWDYILEFPMCHSHSVTSSD